MHHVQDGLRRQVPHNCTSASSTGCAAPGWDRRECTQPHARLAALHLPSIDAETRTCMPSIPEATRGRTWGQAANAGPGVIGQIGNGPFGKSWHRAAPKEPSFRTSRAHRDL